MRRPSDADDRDRPSNSAADRRRHSRVPGSFDGTRLAAVETPLRISDLSEGGCFVSASHEQQLGITIDFVIDLPYEGKITVKGETLHRRPDFGFAVRFIHMSPDDAAKLRRCLERLREG